MQGMGGVPVGDPLSTTTEPGPEFSTRPGTPMIGPYSVNQIDDFYAALAVGQVKPTGVMNYIQRLFVAERGPPGARLVAARADHPVAWYSILRVSVTRREASRISIASRSPWSS